MRCTVESMSNPQTGQPAQQAVAGPRGDRSRYRGEVVYIFAFDVAYEMRREPVRELFGQPAAQFVVDSGKRSPRQLFFYHPQMVRLPPTERIGPLGPVRVERTVKVLPVGAISIIVRVGFEVDQLAELVAFHDLRFNNGTLYEEVRALAEDARRELQPYYVRPNEGLSEEEAYTVFCIDSEPLMSEGGRFNAEDWLAEHRRQVAALLTQEQNVEQLSETEADESTGRYLSYYHHDLVVADWDAALIIDNPRNFDETLYIMELANLQLAELEAYDRLLDSAVERAYRDVSGASSRPRRNVLRELGELRIDLARMSDELLNITKFFGDWHLARIYQILSDRFHLGQWHRTIDQKLRTVDGLYQILKQDRTNRTMVLLEAMIVLLFVIDLIAIVLTAH